MKKTISFIPADIEVVKFVESPTPASKYVPQWYKKIIGVNRNNLEWQTDRVKPVLNLKNCMPFLDALTGGYMMTTWCDLHIEKDGNNVNYRYGSGPNLLETRQSVAIELGKDFYDIEFIWKSYWRAKLPSGYSLLITHPMNRLDLPFQTLSAVVDADGFHHQSVGNIPFYIKKDFEGLIPCGTPMFQIFPFKRDQWEKKDVEFNADEREKSAFLMSRLLIDSYKRQFWQKKSYT
jgi:hypothetical protein